MRLVPEIFEAVQSGKLIGENAPNGRVTVDPYWTLRSTNTIYGNSQRGPYRYYTDGSPQEYEVPSIQSISIQRGVDQDVASCDINLYNMWHEGNESAPELVGQLGKPGFFWPKRGEDDSEDTWTQEPGRGAYHKDGTWESGFSWQNVLVEDAIIRTYQGYGGNPEEGNYVSIDENLTDENVVITGVWIIDTVTGNSDGLLQLKCRDIGRLLLEQLIFPPLVPSALYPLEYFPEGKSAFDSFWGAKVGGSGIIPSSKGEVKLTPHTWSGSGDSTVNSTYPLADSVDGDNSDYCLSDATEAPDDSYVTFQWDLVPAGATMNEISFKPWAGGYTCYVSIYSGGAWQGSESIYGTNYVKKVNIPHAIPDNDEDWIHVTLRDVDDQSSAAAHYATDRVMLTFEHLYYSHVPNASGYRYRAGIRDIIAYRTGDKVSPYSPNFSSLPWTFALEQHPTRGYWVADDSGNVYGFGDAADYDTTGLFSVLPITGTNKVVALGAHPSGTAYWAMDWKGTIWGSGVGHYGHHVIADPYVPLGTNEKLQAVDMAVTHTGNGYWVAYSNGVIYGFGDAEPAYTVLPQTPVATYMEAYLRNNYEDGTYHPYNETQRCKAIASHPHEMGYWVTDGSGQVWGVGTAHKGQLNDRVYNAGMADEFRLGPLEWATSMETTATGDGYWISFASGKLAAFGDAVDQGPVDIYEAVRPLQDNIVIDPDDYFDPAFFRAFIWAIARDPDGSGFWYLSADGHVGYYEADFWGQPGYQGQTGYRWHDGNFDGDYTQIVRELLLWSGFTFYDSGITGGESPAALGRLESTGIKTDTRITPDRFDKKFVIDAIRELAEVVGYRLYITEEGGVNFASPNWWSAGNLDENGEKIYVEAGTFIEGDETDELFIPVVHESADMLSYSATLSSSDKRSELIIGMESPNPQFPDRKNFVRHVPPDANETIHPGVSSMRGIIRQGIWTNGLFENLEEAELMAELIGIHAWFAKRTGSTTAIANPCISLDDQIRLVERNTSETYIHLVTSLSTQMNLDEGTYTMDVGSHWLGNADEWVLTSDPAPGEPIYVSISERLDRWQSETNRGLGYNAAGDDFGLLALSGEFDTVTVNVSGEAQWGVVAEAYLETGSGDTDTFNFLNFMAYGNGVLWPRDTPDGAWEDGGTTFGNTYTGGTLNEMEPMLTLGLCPDPYQEGGGDTGPDIADPTPFVDELIEILTTYSIYQVVVWQDMEEIGYDTTRYMDFYNEVYAAVKALNPTIRVFGPNVNLAARSAGYDTSYGGVTVDSRDMDYIDDFISDADGYDGIAISGSFSDDDWSDLVDYIKGSVTTESLLVSLRAATATPTNLHDSLSSDDIALWPSGDSFTRPYTVDETGTWSFSGDMQFDTSVSEVYCYVDKHTAPLGEYTFLKIYNDSGTLLYNYQLPAAGQSILIGNLGIPSTVENYTFTVKGIPSQTGTGQLKLRFDADGMDAMSVEDSVLILEA